MKKARILLVLFLVFVMAFTACKSQDVATDVAETPVPEQTEATQQASEQEQAEQALEDVELTWYYIGSPQAGAEDVYAAANKIIKEKINATVKFQCIDWGSYEDKMNLMINAGEEFDICFTANWSNNYVQNVQKNAFLPLDDLLDEYAPTLRSMVPDAFWDATRVEGKIYGVINYQISTMTNVLTINKELADKYGFDVDTIKKYEDIEPFLKTLKENETDVIPVNNYAKAGSFWGLNLARVGFDEIAGRNIPGVIRISDESLQVINQFESDEFIEYATLMRDWYEKGYIRSDAISINDDTADMQAGKIGVYQDSNYSPSSDVDNFAKWGFETYAVPVSEPVLLTSSIIATMQGISRTSSNPERAMMLMELVNTDVQLYNLLSYGIEGKHYKMLEDGTIRLLEDSDYNPGTKWLFGSTGNAYLLEGSSPDIWEKTVEMNESGIPSPMLGFTFDSEPVNSQIAQCNSVVDEYIAAIDTGSMDIDTILPEFQEKLRKAGAQEIIDEMQRQINEWLKTK